MMRVGSTRGTLGFNMRIRILLAFVALAGLTLALACGDGDDNGASNGANDEADGGPAGVLGPDSPIVHISSPSIDVGSEGDAVIEVIYNLTPGIAAWTFDIKFDTDIVSVAECDPLLESAVCNPEYEDDTVRFVGASLGIEGATLFGSITFRCDEAGESTLELSVETLADGTIGGPVTLAPYTEDGTITCG